MGPPFFDGGNDGLKRRDIRIAVASMGPPFFDGGNATSISRWMRTTSALQWGRRFLTAETCRWHPLFAVAIIASMGPPFFDGGNVSVFQ